MLRDVASSAFEGKFLTYATMRGRMVDLAHGGNHFPDEREPNPAAAEWLEQMEQVRSGLRCTRGQ
jgi:hypothetical protein